MLGRRWNDNLKIILRCLEVVTWVVGARHVEFSWRVTVQVTLRWRAGS